MKNGMKRIYCVGIFMLLVVSVSVAFFKVPSVSYDEHVIKTYEKEYTTLALVCYEDYEKDKKENTTYAVNEQNGILYRIKIHEDNKYIDITEEEIEAIKTVDDTMRLDKHGLDCIRVYDNFVAFCTVCGNASYVYSINGESPEYVNRPDDVNTHGDKKVCVEKITKHWYFTCWAY